jgi:hypothetical protein
METRQPSVELKSTITCPHCGHQATESMPTDACVGFYPCKRCGPMLRPKQGHCCVFCTYGSMPCPANSNKQFLLYRIARETKRTNIGWRARVRARLSHFATACCRWQGACRGSCRLLGSSPLRRVLLPLEVQELCFERLDQSHPVADRRCRLPLPRRGRVDARRLQLMHLSSHRSTASWASML